MSRFLFVGERPSEKAFRMGWTWESGRLAAKPLFEALAACGIAPQACGFVNLFGERPDAARSGTRTIDDRLLVIRAAAEAGTRIVALGNRVSAALVSGNVPHLTLIHPAARGAIRLRETYVAHVREVLVGREWRVA
jgi:hypothetical protein